MPIVMSDITNPRDLLVQDVAGATHVLAVRTDGTVVRTTMAALLAEVDARIAAAVAAHLAAYTHVAV
jgi:predicted regulator of Ras-like GTPase activity (Roadblock/LC7/MglB family)